MDNILFYCAVVVAIVTIVALWKVFVKAGRPGWASLVPIYNTYVTIKIAQKPGWWLLLLFIPFVNLVFLVLICMGVARHFGRSNWFGLGLAVFPYVFLCILGFNNDKYSISSVNPQTV